MQFDGPVEGASRHLIGDRLVFSGARWGLQGAEAVLTLRALISNGDFDDYWRHHLAQEHQRLYPRTPQSQSLSVALTLTPNEPHPHQFGGNAQRPPRIMTINMARLTHLAHLGLPGIP